MGSVQFISFGNISEQAEQHLRLVIHFSSDNLLLNKNPITELRCLSFLLQNTITIYCPEPGH